MEGERHPESTRRTNGDGLQYITFVVQAEGALFCLGSLRVTTRRAAGGASSLCNRSECVAFRGRGPLSGIKIELEFVYSNTVAFVYDGRIWEGISHEEVTERGDASQRTLAVLITARIPLCNHSSTFLPPTHHTHTTYHHLPPTTYTPSLTTHTHHPPCSSPPSHPSPSSHRQHSPPSQPNHPSQTYPPFQQLARPTRPVETSSRLACCVLCV
jgi:hypothetical protein